jgi:hypothetical protein
MKNVRTCSWISWLLVLILLGSATVLQAQDLFTEVQQLKDNLSDLRSEVSSLKTLVYGLRKAMLESTAAAPAQQPGETASSKKEAVVKPEPAVDDKELTRVICKAVGKFFEEADASLKARDSTAANESMDQARKKLNAALKDYSGTHRVSKLLGIYEGVAWDTYVAVALRQSIQGNQDFMDALNRHKRKYVETCPKE